MPAGVWNLRLKAPGFAATYRWGLDLAAARERSLGTLELRRGTSLTGQVVTEDGSADLRAVRVEVRPLATCRPATERQNHEAQQLVADSAVDEQGYFTLYDLPAGDYDVTARSSGYAPASRSGVLLKDGRDTLIQSPLQLRRPLLLELSIRPAEELYGRQWAVRLIRLLPRSRPEIAATGLARGGVFKTAPLPPGGYRVEVSDSRGNRLAQSELRLDAGAQQHSIDLDLIPVDGKVSLGGAPLAASIWFGGETGGGLKIEARSNGEGDFHVVLPGAGKWSADVQSDEPSVRSRKVAVEIDRPQAGSTAQTRIELPDTVLRGEVVDGTGKGLESVPVRLLALEPQPRSASVSSDSQGRFELRGQDPGSYQLQAVTKGVSSPVVQAVLQEGVVAGPVRLVLRPTLQVKGRVRSPGGPVPLAWILGYPLGSNDAMAAVHLPQITSGVDGSFTLEVPPETSAVRLVVLAGGFDFHVETLPAEVWQGGLLTVSVERSGGTVRLVGLGDDRSSQAVMIDGVPVERPLLEQWAGINGATRAADVLELPAMPSANYTVCRTTPRELMRLMTGAPVVPGPACKEGYLTPGGELSLSVAPRS